MDASLKIRNLALRFPTLRRAEGLQPWQPVAFDAWAARYAPGAGALHAARFLLALWNGQAEWSCGRFDAVDALATWDRAHRTAFLAWASEPWWP